VKKSGISVGKRHCRFYVAVAEDPIFLCSLASNAALEDGNLLLARSYTKSDQFSIYATPPIEVRSSAFSVSIFLKLLFYME